ncbi:hypothetical protein IE53DRAFT_147886 [Violaceomyces palustris]|uniref:Uncharacterized protein n=1 Tax=Violaceomyces palustris TaxID=1673888 RepID=A0ACD0NU82_9BASI|nr:hypothetical protein IE53DRAFT_147886 [Violaceomyces palustris]
MAKLTLSKFLLLAVAALGAVAQQQNSSGSAASTTPTQSSSSGQPSVTLSTSTITTTLAAGQTAVPSRVTASASHSGSVYYIPTTVTVTPTPTSASLANSTQTTTSAAPASTTSAAPKMYHKGDLNLPLDTKVDPAFGVLGVVLLATGLPMTFYGHRNRWSSYFIAGFYSLALITISIILKVGVEQAVNDPSKGIRGLFLLASVIAGAIGGALAIVFWQGAALLVAGLGGFSLGLFLQALRSGGLIAPIGLRFILYIGLFALSFALACIKRIHSIVLAVATAVTGATAVTLAIDCYSTQGLKEFYIRNLGFDSLFEAKYPPTFQNGNFPLVQGMQIQLGVAGALMLMGMAFQARLWNDLRENLKALKKSDEERKMRSKAERAARRISRSAQRDLELWESRHGYMKTASRPMSPDEEKDLDSVSGMGHTRKESLMSLMRSSSADPFQRPGTTSTLDATRHETPSGTLSPVDYPFPTSRRSSSFLDYINKRPREGDAARDRRQSSGPLPVLELGDGLTKQIPVDEPAKPVDTQQALLDEIANIRKSIQNLRSTTPSLPLDDGRPSFTLPAAPTSTKSFDFQRSVTPEPAAPVTQNFRQRASSTAALMEGTTSFLNDLRSTPKTPAFPPPQLVPPSQTALHPSTQHPPLASAAGVPPATVPNDSISPSASQSQYSSQYYTQQQQFFPQSSDPRNEPGFASHSADAHEFPSENFAQPRFSQHEYARSSSSAMMMRQSSYQGHEAAEYHHDRERSNSHTHQPRSRTQSNTRMSSEELGMVQGSRRPIIPRKSDAPEAPWTNPGMEATHAWGRSQVKAERRKSLTIEELDARHRAKLSALQKPATESIKEQEALRAAKEEWERKQALERRRMAAKSASANPAAPVQSQAADPSELRRSRRLSSHLLGAVGEESGNPSVKRADEWRRSIASLNLADPQLPGSQKSGSGGATSQAQGQQHGQQRSQQARTTILSGSRSLAKPPAETVARSKTGPNLKLAGSSADPRGKRISASQSTQPQHHGEFEPQADAKRRNLSETDRRRLSQGAGGGDRNSRRLSQPLLQFDYDVLEQSMQGQQQQQGGR